MFAWVKLSNSSARVALAPASFRVVSAGKDGQYGTDDDYFKSRVDYNKSKWLGRKGKEKVGQFLKGWAEGSPSRHER